MEIGKRDLAQAGDTIEVVGRGVGKTGRAGEILEVLGETSHPHFRVRWNDGTESVFYPSSDAIVRRRSAPAKSRRRPAR